MHASAANSTPPSCGHSSATCPAQCPGACITRSPPVSISTPPVETYWRPIAGSQLYLVANTIANYNIRYVESQTTPEALIVDLLGEDVVITRLPREDTNM